MDLVYCGQSAAFLKAQLLEKMSAMAHLSLNIQGEMCCTSYSERTAACTFRCAFT
ncbi:hypothetical protein J6590_028698 [Homalodisca vitripennis]|nr:hypothetical protein J6590_028698 [Homalodisca vitripennis]